MNTKRAFNIFLLIIMIVSCSGCGVINTANRIRETLSPEKLKTVTNNKGTLNIWVVDQPYTKIMRTTTTDGYGNSSYYDTEYTYHEYTLVAKSSYDSIIIEGIRIGTGAKLTADYDIISEGLAGAFNDREFPVRLSRGEAYTRPLGGMMYYKRIVLYTNFGDFAVNPYDVLIVK